MFEILILTASLLSLALDPAVATWHKLVKPAGEKVGPPIKLPVELPMVPAGATRGASGCEQGAPVELPVVPVLLLLLLLLQIPTPGL